MADVTTLTGGVIESTADAALNHLTTGSLIAKDIANYADASAKTMGYQANVMNPGGATGGGTGMASNAVAFAAGAVGGLAAGGSTSIDVLTGAAAASAIQQNNMSQQVNAMATLTQWLASVLLSSHGGDGAGQSALEALVSTIMVPARAHAGVVDGAVPLPTQQVVASGVGRAPLRYGRVPRVDAGGGIRLVAPYPAVAAVPYGGQDASATVLKNISHGKMLSGADAAALPRLAGMRHQEWTGRAGGLGTGAHTLRLLSGVVEGAGAGGLYSRPLQGLVHLLGHVGVRSASMALRHAVVRTLQQEYAAWPGHKVPSSHAGLMAHVVPPGVLGAGWGAKEGQALALPAVPAQYLHATSQAVGFASTVAPARVQPGPAVQAQITVNATGSTPRAIGDELERRMDTLRMQARQANLGQF